MGEDVCSSALKNEKKTHALEHFFWFARIYNKLQNQVQWRCILGMNPF